MAHYESGGNVNFLLDAMYAKLGTTVERPLTSVDFTLKQWLVEAGATFGRTGNQCHFAEWLVGGRYFSFDSTLSLSPQNRTLSGSRSWSEPFVGGRYGTKLSDRWGMLVNGNVGGFGAGSRRTWEGVLRFDYQLNADTAVAIGARYLNIDYDRNNFKFEGTFFRPPPRGGMGSSVSGGSRSTAAAPRIERSAATSGLIPRRPQAAIFSSPARRSRISRTAASSIKGSK